jgi:uncharacterized protein (UPF0216 family)
LPEPVFPDMMTFSLRRMNSHVPSETTSLREMFLPFEYSTPSIEADT